MKHINEYINEKMALPVRLPELDGKEIAHTTDGEGWIVDDYGYADSREDMNRILRNFHDSGAVAEGIKNGDILSAAIIVGAHNVDDERELMAWEWGRGAGKICYEN